MSVLAIYSLPCSQTRIVAGTKITDFEQVPQGGGSIFRVVPLKNDLEYPIVSPEEAIAAVTQFYKSELAANVELCERIGFIAQGRIQRSANLNKFIWGTKLEV